MLKKIIYLSILLCSFSFAAFSKTVFIILPIEHKAINEIVAGFQDGLRKQFKSEEVKFIVRNALGDINIQRLIIQQAKDQKPDLIVPIGTSTSQMTAAMIQNIPVLAMASLPIEGRNVTGVNDEVPVSKAYAVMKAVRAKLKDITVIYTPQDKNDAELKKLEALVLKDKVTLNQILIPNLTDLYMNVQSVSEDTDFMFIFKDNLIANGITVLINQANMRKIPLMTSDEGTVSKGACFALGVRERSIGTQSSELAFKILTQKEVMHYPFESLKKLSFFRNKKACEMQDLNPNLLSNVAKQFHYTMIDLN